MNRQKSSMYALRLDLLYGAVILVLWSIRMGIDRALDPGTWLGTVAQPVFWFLLAASSMIFGVIGVEIRCGLRLLLRYLLIAAAYFVAVVLLNSTGIPTILLLVVSAILAVYSAKLWHREIRKILTVRKARLRKPDRVIRCAADLVDKAHAA